MKNLKKLSRENLKNLKGGGGIGSSWDLCDDLRDVSNCYSSYDHCRLYSGSGCATTQFCGQTLYCV
ncbi:bacteriocin-like protein [Chryseobacterium indoltheticum]|uniref:bacteriocin-like protein n=1 Tax=Chryseobacterium indoltheticum TaxID=254 RepID=UPI003F499EAB